MTKWYFADKHGEKIDASVKNEDICGFNRLISKDPVAEFADPIEGSASAGRVLMRCVPYNTEGPHWRGTVQFQKGCFTESLKKLKAKEEVMFVQANGHYSRTLEMVASSGSKADRGTVKFEDKDDGLYAEVELANTTAGRDIYELVAAEVVNKVSVGVYIEEYSAKKKDPDKYEEDVTITKAILDETSFVPRPRFDEAEAKIASNDQDGKHAGYEDDNMGDKLDDKVHHGTIRMEMNAEKFMSKLDEVLAAVKSLEQATSDEEQPEADPARGLALVAEINRNRAAKEAS